MQRPQFKQGHMFLNRLGQELQQLKWEEQGKKRNDLVKEIMKQHKLSLPEASKHIKAHKRY